MRRDGNDMSAPGADTSSTPLTERIAGYQRQIETNERMIRIGEQRMRMLQDKVADQRNAIESYRAQIRAETAAMNALKYRHDTGHIREMHEKCERSSCIVCELFICSVCGGIEGALLPTCPGRKLTEAEHDANYLLYCQGEGPFSALAQLAIDQMRKEGR